MCQKTKNFRLEEVLIGNVNQKDFYFSQDEIIRDAKRIVGIEAFKVGRASLGPETNLANVNDTVFAKSFLTLQDMNGSEMITKVPLIDLSRADNNGVLFQVDIPPLNITKCKITVVNNTGLLTTEVFLIAFHYEK